SFILVGVEIGMWGGGLAVFSYLVFAILFSQGFLRPLIEEDPLALSTWVSEGASFLLVVLILSVLLWAFSRDWQAVLVDISESNRQLRQQTARLQAATRVARAGSSTLDPVKLKTELVDTLYDEFSPLGVYFVGLYLLPDGETVATLRVAAGDAEREPLVVGETVTVAEDSTVGWCLSRQESHLVVGPEYSQLVLPLLSRERLLGALSVYGEQSAALDEGSKEVFQTLADQVALAIDNAQLFTRTEAALEEVRAVHRHYLVEEWQKYLSRKPTSRFNYLRSGEKGIAEEQLCKIRQQAGSQGRLVKAQSVEGETSEDDILVVPLKLREQVIGTLALHDPGRHSWRAEELAMVENVTEQTALTIENLRLMGVTQRRAVREHLVQNITTQMQRATDLEALMRIASQELLDALDGSQVHVELKVAAALEATGESGDA
ncbi:MAG: GAF domain-containing protein, partial [Chloroflexota bacterium]|nr:GAF domain-containing protein [Chloroflexota bacterium]